MMQFGEELQPTGAHGQLDPAVVHVGLGGYAPLSHHAGEEDTEMPDITRERFPYGKLLLLIVNCLTVVMYFLLRAFIVESSRAN